MAKGVMRRVWPDSAQVDRRDAGMAVHHLAHHLVARRDGFGAGIAGLIPVTPVIGASEDSVTGRAGALEYRTPPGQIAPDDFTGLQVDVARYISTCRRETKAARRASSSSLTMSSA